MEEIKVIRRKRKSHIRRKIKISIWAWILILGIGIYAVLRLLNNSIYPSMETLAQAQVEKLAVEAMNDAIRESLSSKLTNTDLLTATENGEKVYMLSADPVAMNQLSYQFSDVAQKKLSDISELGISLSLGTLSGLAPLSGLGPNIKVRFTPAANVKSEFTSTLQNSGINQTLYRVNVVLTADIYIILPGKSSKITVKTDAAIAESVIVGEVPQVYTNVSDKEDMMNLIPTDLP